MKKAFIVLSIILFLSQQVLAQDFSLKEAIDYALNHNPKIIIAKDKIKKAEVIIKAANKRLDLNISVHVGYSPLSDKQGMGFSVSQDLERLLGANRKEKDLASLDLNSAKQEYIIAEQQIVREVVSAFNNLETAQDNARLKDAEHLDAEKILEFAQEKFNLGNISMDELLAKQRGLRESEFAAGQARKQLEEAHLVFYQAIGYQEK